MLVKVRIRDGQAQVVLFAERRKGKAIPVLAQTTIGTDPQTVGLAVDKAITELKATRTATSS